jgi:hypothetical protein
VIRPALRDTSSVSIKPTPTVTNDVNLVNLDDDMWQVMVLTHVFINDREVGQSVWSNIVSVRVPS